MTFYNNYWGKREKNIGFTDLVYNYATFAKEFDYSNNMPYRNIQLFNLGSKTETGFRVSVTDAIDTLKSFDLVLIEERLQESLVLLKHTLGWEWSDIVTFTKENLLVDPRMSEELTDGINSTLKLFNAGMSYLPLSSSYIASAGPKAMKVSQLQNKLRCSI